MSTTTDMTTAGGGVSAFDLAAVCPRLARAHRGRREELAALRREAERNVQRLESLVAHRELQLIRAGALGKARYLDVRTAKLRAAEHALKCERERAKRLEAANG